MALLYQVSNVSRNASEEFAESNVTDSLEKSSRTLLIVKITCYSAICITGTIGNLMLIFSLALERQRKTSQYFILNLATVDLLTCVLSIPFDIVLVALGGWPFGSVLCRIIYPLQTIFMAVSVSTLLCMALERHRAIIHPLKYKIPGRVIILVITLIWVLSAALVSPYALALKMKNGDCVENWPNNDPIYPKMFTLGVFLLLYLGPLCVISVTYTRIGVHLRADSRKANFLVASKKASVKKHARRNIRVVKVFVFAVIAFAVCLLPFHVMWIWSEFGNGQTWPHFSTVLTFAYVIFYANSAVDPYIFGALGRRYNSCRCFYQRFGKSGLTIVFSDKERRRKMARNWKREKLATPCVNGGRAKDCYDGKERLQFNNNFFDLVYESTI